MTWGTPSSCAKLTGDSGSGFEALLIGERRSIRPLAGNWPLCLLGLLQHYRGAEQTSSEFTAPAWASLASSQNRPVRSGNREIQIWARSWCEIQSRGSCLGICRLNAASCRFPAKMPDVTLGERNANLSAWRITFGCSFAVAASSSTDEKRRSVSQAWARTMACISFGSGLCSE